MSGKCSIKEKVNNDNNDRNENNSDEITYQDSIKYHQWQDIRIATSPKERDKLIIKKDIKETNKNK